MAEPMEKPFGHEPDAINYRTILAIAGIFAVVVIAIAVALHLILTHAVIPNHAGIAARPAQIPPTPRLQAHPQTDLAKFRAQKQALLSGYAWNDAQHDYARIPIQRAMQIYAAQHAHVPSPANSAGTPDSASSSAIPAAQGARP
ncbi:MAG TPA: hypothetical protein VIG31_06915 [Rhodanobacteraceae bacterium]|jgi:hypothetical protein